ncbi:MAG: beta-propeller domain-containing protein, partial [archaeon]|nr:beta-propeller domain-containing protein [archaeon]
SAAEGSGDASPSPSGNNYSQTNVQVQGVDEADIVKTDGTYIYAFYKNSVAIVKAYPAGETNVVTRIPLDNIYPQEMFVNGNQLILFGTKQEQGDYPYPYSEKGREGETRIAIDSAIYPPYWSISKAVVQVYDISDRSNPTLEKDLAYEGTYLSSRMIGKQVYFVITSYPQYQIWAQMDTPNAKDIPIIPQMEEDGVIRPIAAPERIGYIPPIQAEQFITLAAMRLDTLRVNQETIVGSAQTVYASENSMYLASSEWGVGLPMPLMVGRAEPGSVSGGSSSDPSPPTTPDEDTQTPLPSDEQERPPVAPENPPEIEPAPEIPETFPVPPEYVYQPPQTIIHKFDLKGNTVEYVGQGKAIGRVLNQFSMDAHNGFFRIATTVDGQWDFRGMETSKTESRVTIFNPAMAPVGVLDGLAPGEQIYSARFMGDRGYLVTFKNVDPLFVLDLSNPRNPTVLGKLKIPGYSNYLHPYDETHLIGIGKDALESGKNDFAWYLGMKMAIFDVSDVKNPIQLHSVVIGDRGTDSDVLYDHKAFLFDKEKGLLVLPIQLHEITEDVKQQYETQRDENPWMDFPPYGEPVFQGAFVYQVDLDNGFVERGRITHLTQEDDLKRGYYFGEEYRVRRALTIGDTLYTVSPKLIQAHDISTLNQIKEIRFNPVPGDYSFTYWRGGGFCKDNACPYDQVVLDAEALTIQHFSPEQGEIKTETRAAGSTYFDTAEEVDWASFQTLPDTFGCPGCADGQTEKVTITRGDASKTITLEAYQWVPELQGVLDRLRGLSYGFGYGYGFEDGVVISSSSKISIPDQ